MLLLCMKAVVVEKLIQKSLNSFLPSGNLNGMQKSSPRDTKTLVSCMVNLRLQVKLILNDRTGLSQSGCHESLCLSKWLPRSRRIGSVAPSALCIVSHLQTVQCGYVLGLLPGSMHLQVSFSFPLPLFEIDVNLQV